MPRLSGPTTADHPGTAETPPVEGGTYQLVQKKASSNFEPSDLSDCFSFHLKMKNVKNLKASLIQLPRFFLFLS